MLKVTAQIVLLLGVALNVSAAEFPVAKADEVSVDLKPGLSVDFFMDGDRVRTIWLRIGDRRLIAPLDNCRPIANIEHGTSRTTILPRAAGVDAIALEFSEAPSKEAPRARPLRYRIVFVDGVVRERVVLRPTGSKAYEPSPLCSP